MKRTSILLLAAISFNLCAGVALGASVCRPCASTCTACTGVGLFDCTNCVADRFLDVDGSCRAYALSCPAEPRLDCTDPAAGSGRGAVDAKRFENTKSRSRVAFAWQRGKVDSVADFGSPVAGETNYALCLYDYSGGVPALKFQARIPRGLGWHLLASGKGFVFRRHGTNASSEGIGRIVLKRRASDGRTRLTAKGKGVLLQDIQPAAVEKLFDAETKVTAQLINDVPKCWQAEFDAATILKNFSANSNKFVFRGRRRY